MRRRRARGFVAVALLAGACACGSRRKNLEPDRSTPIADAGDGVTAAAVARTPIARRPCPDDMVHVETDFCHDVERRCTDVENERANHLSICHAFARDQRCRGEARHLAFCIDRYEYPDRKGAHPVWMVDWSQAQAACESRGKRLCGSNEWTAACEGPEHTPFPYGWERDHESCNIDNQYIQPRKAAPRAQFFFYSKDKDVSQPELLRLDQSVPSGSMESCKSGFGVYDLTGNMDEWVVSDEPPRDRSEWAGLKGGGWGHVRNQCRAMTTSHEPEFTYYFVGFRCCADAAGEPAWTPSPQAMRAPPVPPAAAPELAVDPPAGLGSGPSRLKYSRPGKRE